MCMRLCCTLFILLPHCFEVVWCWLSTLQQFNGFNMYLIFHSVDLLPVHFASTLILLSVRSHLTPLLLLLNIPLFHAASRLWKMWLKKETRPSSEKLQKGIRRFLDWAHFSAFFILLNLSLPPPPIIFLLNSPFWSKRIKNGSKKNIPAEKKTPPCSGTIAKNAWKRGRPVRPRLLRHWTRAR